MEQLHDGQLELSAMKNGITFVLDILFVIQMKYVLGIVLYSPHLLNPQVGNIIDTTLL